jgi:hypothetical protein
VISHPNPLESGGGGGGSGGGNAGATPWAAGVFWRRKEVRRRKKRGPAAPVYLSESRQAAWCDSSLSRAMALSRSTACGTTHPPPQQCRLAPGRRGASVAPHALDRLSEESCHAAWSDQKGYFLQFSCAWVIFNKLD